MTELAVVCDKFKFSMARQDEYNATMFWRRIEEYLSRTATSEEDRRIVAEALLYVRKSTWRSGSSSRASFTIFSFEATGVYAEFLFPRLPAWSLAYISYLHVKTFQASIDVDAYIDLKNAVTNGPMFRQITLFSPAKVRKDGGDIATLPGLRIGHAKSDRQVIMYQSGGQPFGLETRLSGDKLRNVVRLIRDIGVVDLSTDEEMMQAVLWTAHGEGAAYVNRLKEQAGMSEQGVFGPILSKEELSALWGKEGFAGTRGKSGLYDSDGFPIEPINGRKGPKKGRVNKTTGEEFRLTEPLDEAEGAE